MAKAAKGSARGTATGSGTRSGLGRKGQPGRKKGTGGGFVAFLLLLTILVGAGALVWQEGERFLFGAGPAAREGDATLINIPKGTGARAIATQLAEAGVIRSAPMFRLAARVLRADYRFKAGEYRIASGESTRSIIDRIARGDVVTWTITIPEGLPSVLIVEKLLADPVLTGEIATVPDEGSLLPDTYSFTRGEARAAILERMRAAQETFVKPLWERRAADLPFKTLDEALVLASIVEKETGLAKERPLVASVFVNRLRKGMRLESDPTIIYGITAGRPLGRGIRRSELDARTPYNTYQIDGLPPSPIANPGREAIAAVLNPPVSDYLFFVADGTGGHAFAATYAEHAANVARWRVIEGAE